MSYKAASFLFALGLMGACGSPSAPSEPPPAPPAPPQEDEEDFPENTSEVSSVGLTLYNPPEQPVFAYDSWGRYYSVPALPQSGDQGFGVIKERRKITLETGLNTVRIADVAGRLDPTSVHFTSLTDPVGTKVVEQSFEYDLVNAGKLLEKYLDKKISVRLEKGQVIRGRLLAYDSQSLTLDTGSRREPIQVLPRKDAHLSFPSLPDGLMVKPTLVWMIQAEKAGSHDVEIAYQAPGVGWVVDYTAVLGDDEQTLDLSAWVSITNHAGASFPEAGVKLVAGNVQKLPSPNAGYRYDAYNYPIGNAQSESNNTGFSEKSFFEYHLYTLGRKTDLPENSVKQIELFDTARAVKVQKILLVDSQSSPWSYYYGGGDTNGNNVRVVIELKNTEESGLGMPLPKGKVRVYKRDKSDGSLEFLGEDLLDHTPKGEPVYLTLGKSFDVQATRTMTKQTHGSRSETQVWEVKLANRKEEPVEVRVREHLVSWYSNWKITSEAAYEKEDANTVRFQVPLAPGEEKTLTYTVEYRW